MDRHRVMMEAAEEWDIQLLSSLESCTAQIGQMTDACESDTEVTYNVTVVTFFLYLLIQYLFSNSKDGKVSTMGEKSACPSGCCVFITANQSWSR